MFFSEVIRHVHIGHLWKLFMIIVMNFTNGFIGLKH
jgi:hypothetical protein